MADATVDTSITANAGRNMLTSLGQMAGVVNAVNENRLFMGRQAAGQALQQSIDPQTGQVDFQRFNQLITSNPQIAPYAQEALQQGLVSRGQDISNATGQTNLQNTYTANMRQDYLAAKRAGIDPNLALVRGAAMGRYPPQLAATFAGGGEVNGVSQDALAKESAIALGPDAVRAAYGSPETQDQGGQLVTSLVNPVTGEKTLMGGNAAVLPKTLTPAEAVKPAYTEFNPTTQQPEIVTMGAAAAAGAGGPGGAHIPAGPPLGAEQAANTAAQGSANILNADLASQNGAMERINALRKVNDLLATPEGGTGPGTKITNAWRSFLLANAAWTTRFLGGVDQAKIQTATQDELHKYMTQIAGNAAAQYGQGTNEKLAVAASGNPNADISTLANRDVTRMMLALERAKQARMAEWEASGQPPQNYGQFIASWNRTHDPRAFMLDLLSPQERRKMLSDITSDADKRALLRGKSAAENAGLYADKDIPR